MNRQVSIIKEVNLMKEAEETEERIEKDQEIEKEIKGELIIIVVELVGMIMNMIIGEGNQDRESIGEVQIGNSNIELIIWAVENHPYLKTKYTTITRNLVKADQFLLHL